MPRANGTSYLQSRFRKGRVAGSLGIQGLDNFAGGRRKAPAFPRLSRHSANPRHADSELALRLSPSSIFRAHDADPLGDLSTAALCTTCLEWCRLLDSASWWIPPRPGGLNMARRRTATATLEARLAK